MSGAKARHCSRCGAEASGNFCSGCGAPLGSGGCGACGAKLKPGAIYCSECGAATGERAAKPASSRLPWILSFAALAVFSVAIAMLVQRQSNPRVGEMTLTGGVPGQPAPGASAGGMPTMEELAAMSPREAADRLFERAMSTHAGNEEQGTLFNQMARQAYDMVPAPERDADYHFHVGLLQLVAGDSIGARASTETILGAEADNLLGLVLGARVADFRGDAPTAAAMRDRVREVVEAAGGIPNRPEYEAHGPLIDPIVAGAGGGG